MNKTQITSLIACLIFAGGGFVLYSGWQRHRYFIQAQSYAAGNSLINSNSSEMFVNVGVGLGTRWDSFARLPVAIESIQMEDEPAPIGDGLASSRVFFTNGAMECLAIRMRWDEKRKKFHIVGFWTPENAK